MTHLLIFSEPPFQQSPWFDEQASLPLSGLERHEAKRVAWHDALLQLLE